MLHLNYVETSINSSKHINLSFDNTKNSPLPTLAQNRTSGKCNKNIGS